LTLMTRSLF